MNRFFLFPILCVLFIVGLFMQGCTNIERKDNTLLVVERQSLTFNLGDSTTENRRITFDVDVPVSGPKFLADSVMALLNEVLHENCEILLDSSRKTLDEVRTDDKDHLLQHYADIYEPFLKEEYSSYYDLTVEMLAQNTAFITYGVGVLHCGASCGSEMYCYTLSKKDGHRLAVMTADNYSRFLKEKTDSTEYDEEMAYVPEPSFQFKSFGLLGSSVLIISNGATNHCMARDVDYDEIKPYLTEEARLMMEKASAGKKYPKNDWYVGKRLGEVKTESGQIIFLREYDPVTETYNVAETEIEDDDFDADNNVVLRAFSKKNGKDVPENVLELDGAFVSEISFDIPDCAWARPFTIDGFYDYDAAKNELYVMAWKEPNIAHLLVYRFDGQHFTNTGKTIEPKNLQE